MGYRPWGGKESDKTELLTHTHTHTPFGLYFPSGSDDKESACSAGN